MNIMQKSNEYCCGCGVCSVICTTGAIKMNIDREGFYVPVLDEKKCVDCNMCTKVCTKFSNESHKTFLNLEMLYAGETKDREIKKRSSSGGIGYELSKLALSEGYRVIGVVYDSKRNVAQHYVAKTEEELEKLQGSKYLQSITDVFSVLNSCAKENQKYLVFGTPCQIKALRKFAEIKKFNERIILVDVFCRGVPTYLLWRRYLSWLREKHNLRDIQKIIFRNKEKGWHSCSILCESKEKVYSSAAKDDWFYKMYTSALCFRDSCYTCKLKLEECYSDIRLGDFWGSRFEKNEEGMSIVIVNTEKGKDFLGRLSNCEFYKANISEVKEAQKYIYNKKTSKIYKMRRLLASEKGFDEIYKALIAPGFWEKWLITLYKNSPEKFKKEMRKIKKKCGM